MSNNTDLSGIKDGYGLFIRKKVLVLFSLLLLLLICAVLSMLTGSTKMTLPQILMALERKGPVNIQTILWNIRLPKISAAVSVGISLALAGCVMQCVLSNPLASASTLGVSQGATFGAAFSIICLGAGIQANSNTGGSISITNPGMVTMCAFIGGVLTSLFILGLAGIAKVSPGAMVLSGVAISSMFSGATTIIQYFADDVRVASVVYWTFGDLGRTGWKEIGVIAGLNLVAALYFFFRRWDYNALADGVDSARSLGINSKAVIVGGMLVSTMITAVAVAFVGTIAFIGLVAPHIARLLVGEDHRFLLPASALMGAVLLVSAELVSRTLVSPVILPIGALTSFLGAPLFVYMILKGKGKNA